MRIVRSGFSRAAALIAVVAGLGAFCSATAAGELPIVGWPCIPGKSPDSTMRALSHLARILTAPVRFFRYINRPGEEIQARYQAMSTAEKAQMRERSASQERMVLVVRRHETTGSSWLPAIARCFCRTAPGSFGRQENTL